MANALPMQTQKAILALHAQGRSIRPIARDLDIHRNTLRGYLVDQPDEEAQVDFGLGAPNTDSNGRKRRTWAFRIVLSFSRKTYSESVQYKDTETFIRALENAFRAFHGVPRTLNPDNLKAADKFHPLLQVDQRHPQWSNARPDR